MQTTCLHSLSAHTPAQNSLLFVSFYLCLCVCLIARVWWRHVLKSHYALCTQKVLPDHANTTAWGGSVHWEEMSGREWNVCVHYAYEPLPRFPTTPHAKGWNWGDAADAYMSELIFIMCSIEKSKLLFTLEPFSLCWLAYQSRGDDMEESSPTRADQSRPDPTGPGV